MQLDRMGGIQTATAGNAVYIDSSCHLLAVLKRGYLRAQIFQMRLVNALPALRYSSGGLDALVDALNATAALIAQTSLNVI